MNSDKTTLKGILGRVRFSSDDGEFSVAELEVSGGKTTTIVGNLLETQPGEHVVVSGVWRKNAKFGPQLEIDAIRTVPPTTLEGIERYLASGLVEGVGPVLAERIVATFGADTLDIIDADPKRIREVPGIGKKRGETIAQAWELQRSVRNVMVFLQSHGITPSYALRIWKAYGADAIRVIQENPYNLAEEIHGIGFKIADNIARRAGIDVDAMPRLRAGVLHTLAEAGSEGHVYLPMEVLLDKTSALLGLRPEQISAGITDVHEDQRVYIDTIDGEPAVYRAGLWRTETEAADRLRALAAVERRFRPQSVEYQIDAVEAEMQVELAFQQREAVRSVWDHKVAVITGGPGTGKTTIVRVLCELADHLKQRFALAAPTGRASRRMSEATGRPAMTIHRLLEFNPREGGFQYNSERPLDLDLLIVDEASMIDIYLLYALVDALPADAAIVFVGDIDQLPSVGPGQVLRDIMDSGVAHVVELTDVFRQALDSTIVTNAHRINRGEMPIDAPRVEGVLTDFYTIATEDPRVAQDRIVELVTSRIPAAFGVDATHDVQVLAPMHRGEVGCSSLNRVLQSALTGQNFGVERGQTWWREGDKVMQTRNSYERGVFNGDIGWIRSVDTAKKQLYVEFEDKMVSYEFSELDELQHAFAVTVHKSQGSEYPVVVMPVMTQHYVMLQRNLLYTAVTRARKLVVLVGSARAVGLAVRNATAGSRYTGLAWRLRR
ncbi:MAG: ATP-dependent RecD-like DNA helicase [bacterium]